MKKIITTLTDPFEFRLSGTRKLILHPKVSIEVSDEEFEVLKKRLGHQIKEYSTVSSTVSESKPKTVSKSDEDEDEEL